MATKEENVKRLLELAAVLGREADISGSAVDIQQRVAEWEEEMLAFTGAGNETRDAGTGGQAGLVEVRVRVTQHMEAFTADGTVIDDIVPAGMTVWIPAKNASVLEDAGLTDTI